MPTFQLDRRLAAGEVVDHDLQAVTRRTPHLHLGAKQSVSVDRNVVHRPNWFSAFVFHVPPYRKPAGSVGGVPCWRACGGEYAGHCAALGVVSRNGRLSAPVRQDEYLLQMAFGGRSSIPRLGVRMCPKTPKCDARSYLFSAGLNGRSGVICYRQPVAVPARSYSTLPGAKSGVGSLR